MTQNNLQKGASALIVIAIIALALVVGGVAYYVIQQQTQKSGTPQEKALIEIEKEGVIMIEEEVDKAMMEKEGEAISEYNGEVLAGASSPLLEFNKTDYMNAINSEGLIVLYFYANWCPICKNEVANALYPAFNELMIGSIVGFRVNFNDDETDNDERDLAREFGVAYQHTKVFLKNGERILKSPATWNKTQYLSEINKVL